MLASQDVYSTPSTVRKVVDKPSRYVATGYSAEIPKEDSRLEPSSQQDSIPDSPPESKSHTNAQPLPSKPSMKMDGSTDIPPPAIDPLSRHILARTYSQHKVSGLHNASISSQGGPAVADETKVLARQTTMNSEADALRRTDSLLSNKASKEKKKGVSFLSRIMGNKKKDESPDASDTISDLVDNRELGTSAEVFSQPIGFVPKFPAPPRYIRVKSQNRSRKQLDRLFLAQILSESAPRSRKGSDEVDAKIHSINDQPVVQPPNSGRTKNNAVWAAECSRDGQYFAAAGQDKKLKVWRVVSSKEDREGTEGEDEQQVKLNAPVFKQELVREYEGHTSAILDLSWSKNNFLLSSSMDKTVRLYHISRPECLCAFKHNDFVTSISFHPRDDRFFLAGSLDSKIRLWSIPDKSVAYWAQAQDMVTAVAFTPDGKTAIAGTLTGLCTLYDTEGLKAHSQIHVRSNRGKNSKGSKITGIETIQIARALGPPDVKILITSNDSRIRMYNLRDRSLEAKFRGNENNTSQIRASFSDDGKYVVCGSEDKRVYVWSTEPIERQDSDKRPVEMFEAHNAAVTTALLLPTKARRMLARSGDPIYDLCNPPPVRLLSRTDSVLSSQAPTQISGSDERGLVDQKAESPPQATVSETPQQTAKHSHNECGGFILVTGDYTGEIKVFRQDCAYQKRREGSWDTASFSRKMLGRSGSVATRTSERSSVNRKSMTFDSRSPANDSIINWRNSIMSDKPSSATTSASEPGSPQISFSQDRDRSSSPNSRKKGLAHRLSLRHGSTPLSNASRASIEDSSQPRRSSTQPQPQTQSGHHANGTNNTSSHPHYLTALEQRHVLPFAQPSGSTKEQPIPGVSITTASPPPNAEEDKGEHNGLFLVGDHSYMAWDVKNTLIPMMNTQPRTPGDGLRPNPISREGSFVSSLSSERLSDLGETPNEERGQELGDRGGNSSNEKGKSDGEELKCKNCGNESFKMVRQEGAANHQVLKCRKCGHEVV